MYSNLIYLITVILIHSFNRSADPGFFDPGIDGALLALSFLGFALVCRWALKPAREGVYVSYVQSLRHRRTVSRLSMAAVGLFACQSFFFDLDIYLRLVPGAGMLATLEALLAVAFFLGHLCALWYFDYPGQKRFRPTTQTRTGYIWSNLRFYLALILPWAAVSMPSDMGALILKGRAKELFLGPWGQAGYLAVALLLLLAAGPRLVVWGWGCRDLPEGRARDVVQSILEKFSLKFKGILGWPLMGGDAPNAAVLGFFRGFRYLLITPSLLGLLNPRELEAVVAHEAGHVKKRHLLIHLLLVAGLFPLVFLMEGLVEAAILRSDTLYRILVVGDMGRRFISLGSLALLALAAVGYLRFVMGYFIRNMEREADLFALRALGDPMPLVTSLEKLASATGGHKQEKSWHHYGVGERIDFLLSAGVSPERGALHERRLKLLLGLFVAFAAATLFAGLSIRPPDQGPQMAERRVRLMVAVSPKDPEVLRLAGDFYYSKKRWTDALGLWESSLRLDPDNPETLNNLAWLLATCEDARLRNPREALDLADRAARISPTSPHILDTLAEAHFRLGRVARALELEERALALARENRPYYLKQMNRFRRKLEERERTI